MIQVKAPVTGWHKADRETALKIAKFYYNRIACVQDKIGYINTHKLRGISFTENDVVTKPNGRRR